jgi:hypothetical protein
LLINTRPNYRTLFHDKIDKEQIAIDKMDGAADTVVTLKKIPPGPLHSALPSWIGLMPCVIIKTCPQIAGMKMQQISITYFIEGLLSETLNVPAGSKTGMRVFMSPLVNNLDSLIICGTRKGSTTVFWTSPSP